MNSDIQWFLGFLLIIGVFAYTGWSARKSGTFLGVATSTPVSVQFGTAEPSQPQRRERGTVAPSVERAEPDHNVAPLRGKLTIASVSRGGTGQSEYLLIQAARENTMQVAITGLEVQSAVTHIGVKVPRAWKLPFPGASGDGEPVTLAPGAAAYLITGRSGNGISFQLNSCTGYFANTQNFSPSVPRECPSPLAEPLPPPPNQLSDACLDYIATIPSCTVPSSIPLQLQGDGNCQAHVFNKINYDTCVSLHKNEPGFYRGDWRLYLGRDSRLWRERRETIELLDADGKLISSYSY